MLYRNDDVCNGFDYDKYVEVRSVFESFGIKELYSVIPYGDNVYIPNAHLIPKEELEKTLGKEQIHGKPDAFIRDSLARGHDIALHGWIHALMSNYSLVEQRENITRAKELLESKYGVKIKYFVPPFNTYNESTMTVCKELGLEILGRNESQLEWLVRDNKPITDTHCWYHAWRFTITDKLKLWLKQQKNNQKELY